MLSPLIVSSKNVKVSQKRCLRTSTKSQIIGNFDAHLFIQDLQSSNRLRVAFVINYSALEFENQPVCTLLIMQQYWVHVNGKTEYSPLSKRHPKSSRVLHFYILPDLGISHSQFLPVWFPSC